MNSASVPNAAAVAGKSKAEKKPALGRGLSVLLAQAEATYGGSDRQGQVRSVSLDRLSPGRFQPRRRFDAEAIEQLASSIRQRGVLQPILVRALEEGRFEIVAGERRWRAAQQAGVAEIPVIVRDLADAEALEIGLVENLQRQDLNALEEAEAFRRLMDEFGHSQQVLADAVGKSRSHIANTLRLLALPDSVKTMLITDRLTAGHARALLGAADPTALADEIVARGLSVREAERLAARPEKADAGSAAATEVAGKAVKVKRNADVQSIEADLVERLGLKVRIAFDGAKGSITLDFSNLEQFDSLLERLTRGE